MKALYLDCFSGISGDMMVGALCDLGVKPSALEWELSKLEIGDFHMHFDRAQRQKIEGVKFGIHEGATHTHDQDDHGHHHGHSHEHGHSHGHDHDHHDHHEHDHYHDHHEDEHDHGHARGSGHVEPSSARLPQANDLDHGSEVSGANARHKEEHAHSHAHAHHHHHEHEHAHDHGHTHHHHHGHSHDHDHGDECCGGHHHHHDHEAHGRTHRQIRELIQHSDLSDFVKKHSLSIFQRIAEAEGKIHGMSAEDVHFHEVGALDSIADIICACVGLENLGVEKVYVSPLHEGRGWIDCAHGRFPLPSPATLEIFKGVGISVGETDETHELITPTGAAIVAEFAVSAGPMPRMKVEKIGYGIGTRDLKSRPNVLRAVIGELE